MKKLLLFALLSIFLTSCFSTEEDLVGTWNYSYTDKSEGIPIKCKGQLIFKENGTFINNESATMMFDFGFAVKGRWETFLNSVKLTYDLSTLEMTGMAALNSEMEEKTRQGLYVVNKLGEWIPVVIENGCWNMEQDDGSIISYYKEEKSESETSHNEQPKIQAKQFKQEYQKEEYSDYEDEYERLWQIGSERKLTLSDINGLSKTERRILRNYFYAREGRKFKSADLNMVFSKYDWFNPLFDNVDKKLSSIQKNNIQFILNNEK